MLTYVGIQVGIPLSSASASPARCIPPPLSLITLRPVTQRRADRSVMAAVHDCSTPEYDCEFRESSSASSDGVAVGRQLNDVPAGLGGRGEADAAHLEQVRLQLQTSDT